MQFFPYLTETFIYREALALRELGLDIITVANRPPNPDQLPPDVSHLPQTTRYIFPLTVRKLLEMLFAHLVFCIRRPGAYVHALRILLGEESRHPRIWLRNIMHFAGAGYLAWILRQDSIDHLHAPFSTNAASLALFASILIDCPCSMTIHNEIFIERLLLPAKLRHAQFIACISDYSRQALMEDYPDLTLHDKFTIVRCGLDPDDFQIVPHKRHTPPVILSASQLVERKGIAYLIAACGILKRRNVPFRCTIAGDGDERANLEALVMELELTGDIHFTGRYSQEDIHALFSDADVFVLPCIVTPHGDRDGIPVVLMEAMAAGLPVVSTTISGISELIQAEVNGLLVEEQNPKTLADAIERLLSDESLCQRLTTRARATVEGEFNIHNTSQRLAKLFTGDNADGSG